MTLQVLSLVLPLTGLGAAGLPLHAGPHTGRARQRGQLGEGQAGAFQQLSLFSQCRKRTLHCPAYLALAGFGVIPQFLWQPFLSSVPQKMLSALCPAERAGKLQQPQWGDAFSPPVLVG